MYKLLHPINFRVPNQGHPILVTTPKKTKSHTYRLLRAYTGLCNTHISAINTDGKVAEMLRTRKRTVSWVF